ncbi:hypothetical protein N8H10_17955 [Curtobacterium flaccumfaciens pv. poinsettiae]|nr:hypothetical protein [Curtobacterium flaccumfaciens pv. poinsettiae]
MITAASVPLQPSTASPLQPPRWQQVWREAIRDPRELLALLKLDPTSVGMSEAAAAQFPLRVPRGFVARMRVGDLHDPLLRQVLPMDAEQDQIAGFGVDAVGDGAAKQATGIIQKYQGRILLIAKLCGALPVLFQTALYRTLKTRLRMYRWREAAAFVRADPSIEEVIFVRRRSAVVVYRQVGGINRRAAQHCPSETPAHPQPIAGGAP